MEVEHANSLRHKVAEVIRIHTPKAARVFCTNGDGVDTLRWKPSRSRAHVGWQQLPGLPTFHIDPIPNHSQVPTAIQTPAQNILMESSTPIKLWDTALEGLYQEDLAALKLASRSIDNLKPALNDVLAAALEKRDECLKTRWKVRAKGKTIVLRDVFDKRTIWIRKFIVWC